MALTKKVRFEVFKRDKFTCQYCGRSAPDVTLQVDHIHPVSEGGTDDLLNLVTSCFDCNQGKKDRLLSDDSVIQKRKRQLDELQERREQLEMLMEWQQGLMRLDDDILQGLRELWQQLVPGYDLADSGLLILKKLLKKYDLLEIADAMRVSTEQYLVFPEVTADDPQKPTAESAGKALSYIQRILANKAKMAAKPYLKDLYYIRGILKNRLNYVNEHKAMQLLEMAYENEVEIEALKNIAKTVRNWTQFVAEISQFIGNDDE